MVMSSVDLADHLFFEEITEDKIIVETNKAFLPVDERNNVYQAALLLKINTISKPVSRSLLRRIFQ